MSEEYELDKYGYPIGFTSRLKKPIEPKKPVEPVEPEEYELDKQGYPIGFTSRLEKSEEPKEPEEPSQERSSFKPDVSTRLMLEAANWVAGGKSITGRSKACL